MAVPLSVECHGKNYMQRLPPMSPLGSLIPGVLKQAGLDSKVKPEECKLFIKDKALDQTLAVRFANIPSTAKIILKTGHEPVLGIIEQPTTTTTVASSKTNDTTTAAAPSNQPTNTDHPKQQQQKQPTATQKQETANNDNNNTNNNKEREIRVFSRQAELDAMAHLSTTTTADLDDAAYEVTERDLRMILAGYAKKKAEDERGLMTKQMREAEMAKKMASYGPVPIRIEFPDGMIVQSTHTASSTVDDVYELVRSVLVKELSSMFYVFTTPPKRELKDLKMTLYGAGLVPAARVHVGFRSGVEVQGCLREEVMAKAGTPPAKGMNERRGGGDSGKNQGDGNGDGGSGEGSSRGVVAREGHEEGGSQQRRKTGGVPKWMKLSN